MQVAWPQAAPPPPPRPQTGIHAGTPPRGATATPTHPEKPSHPQAGKALAPRGTGTPPAKPAIAGTPRKAAAAGTHGKPPAKSPSASGPPASTAAKPAEKPPPPAASEPAAAPAKGSATGLPLPRFAAVRSDEVNLRAGPGTRYPIDWVYRRRDLPVEIEREFEVWRLVIDPDGVKGWMHQATLTGHRSFIVVGKERTLRRKPDDAAAVVAWLMPGVIGHIMHCDAGSDWCRVQVDEYRGWLKRTEFWGSLKGEAIN